jgi:hypothetical protein
MSRTFSEWLREQSYRTDLVGDLAETAMQESDWPQTNTKLAFEVYLFKKDATPLGRRAFEIAYEEWQQSRHLPPINMWMKPSKAPS